MTLYELTVVATDKCRSKTNAPELEEVWVTKLSFPRRLRWKAWLCRQQPAIANFWSWIQERSCRWAAFIALWDANELSAYDRLRCTSFALCHVPLPKSHASKSTAPAHNDGRNGKSWSRPCSSISALFAGTQDFGCLFQTYDYVQYISTKNVILLAMLGTIR